MTTLIELKPNRELLDAQFEGYKLSLDSVPTYASYLICDVDHILPSDDQYSFLHVKAFGLHNHLYGDPWSIDDIYYIDNKWHVQKNVFAVAANAGHIDDWVEVWEVPSHRERASGHYNLSLHLTSATLAVVADGAGTLHLVDTGSRADAPPWSVLFSDQVCGHNNSFVVVDSRLVSEGGQRVVHCLLQHVEETGGDTPRKARSERFKTILEWITLSEEGGHTWSLQSIRKLSGGGAFDYAALERSCRCLYIASDKTFSFIIDSEKPVEMLSPLEPDEEKSYFSWTQTADVLKVWVPLRSEEQVEVAVEDRLLRVAQGGRVLLEGPTWQRVDSDRSSWCVDDCRLEIILPKAEHGIHWSELVRGNVEGEEILDPSLTEAAADRCLSHLTSDTEGDDPGCSPGFNSEQLEECDSLPDMSQLIRLDSHSHSITHQVNLGGHQWLFNVRLDPDREPALCLRFDVDGCVWQAGPPAGDSAQWPCTHVGTFLAFGYVQASKTRRKFTVCSPDMSFVAICEANRHIYVYRQPTPVDGELRNRKSGRSIGQVAKQQLVTLDAKTEVLGIHCSNNYIYVLTANQIFSLQINC